MSPAHVALIGFMGSGKTTLGPRLATRLRRPFVDLDSAIEVECGMSIAEIFRQRGEAAFRELESIHLRRSFEGPPLLLSTGGGIVESALHRELLRQDALVIWLDPPFEVLRRRLREMDATQRPLLEQYGVSGLRDLLDRRRPLYAATAHLRVGSQIANPARLARELARDLAVFVAS